MANTVNYAAIFNKVLDEKFIISSRTSWLENTRSDLIYSGGKEIKIPKLSLDGLGDMVGNKAPDGDLKLEYETKTLEYYRGRNFTIGRYDVEETNFALTVGNALKALLEEHVTPEVDKLRISKLAYAGVNAGHKTEATVTDSNVLSLLLQDIATVQDKIGEDKQLYVQISTKVKALLEQSDKLAKFINTRELNVKNVNLKIDSLNDSQYLVGTPSAYMKTAFKINDGRTSGQTDGGLTPAADAQGVNWIVSAREVADAIARPRISKVISPDENQDGEEWKIMFHIYHGVWVFDNKLDGLQVNVAPAVQA